MSISLRDLRAAKRALNDPCRMHPDERAAACTACYELALRQQDKQWRRQRELAHAEYVQRQQLNRGDAT